MAFTILANSTTADATEVMGNFYYVGAGNRLPYFQTTAGNLSAVDNTYDLGADTTAWRRLYAKQIGDASFDYSIQGQSVTVEATEMQFTATSIVVNSSSSININCTATMQEINNTQGIKHSVGPKIYTAFISIGSWDMTATTTAYVDVSPYINTLTVYPMRLSAIIHADQDERYGTTFMPTAGGSWAVVSDHVMRRSESADEFGIIYYKYVGVPTVPSVRLELSPFFTSSAMFNDGTINRGYVCLEYMRT